MPTSATRSHTIISVSFEPLARRTPDLSKERIVIADRWPLKLTMIDAIFESHNLMLPSSYPAAKISGSVLLCAMAVTCDLQSSSFHRFRSSPFLMSQHKTSSFAATTARPEPVLRVEEFDPSAAQTIFDVLELTSPKEFECSYFLKRGVSQ
jgi:hypothetical protein